jgi:hypothetical protein
MVAVLVAVLTAVAVFVVVAVAVLVLMGVLVLVCVRVAVLVAVRVEVLVAVRVAVAVDVAVGCALTTWHAESSEVLLSWSVALALTNEPRGTLPARLAVKAFWQPPSSTTVIAPIYVCPSP